MATYLFRLGRAAFIHRRLVLAIWLALLIGSSVAAATLSGPTSSSFSIPGTEAQQAIDKLQERFPAAAATGATARVVFGAPAGGTLTDPANQAKVEAVVAQLAFAPKVAFVADPYKTGSVNPDGSVAFATVTYTVTQVDITQADRDALAAAAQAGRAAGLTVEMGGSALQPPIEQGAAEIIGVGVAAVVLFITFGSFIAAGLPLVTGLIGIGIGVGLITTATGFISLSATTSILALMIGLAVSIDYALFIVSRYRAELIENEGLPGEEAAGRAVATSGSAVVFAGLTVVIALSGLGVVGIPILTEMGLAAALTVAIAVIVAITLLPALVGFAGKRILGRGHKPTTELAVEIKQETRWRRWPRFVARRPVVMLVAAVALLGVIALPALDLRLGLPDDSVAGPTTTERKAYDLLGRGFGDGFNGPLTLVVDAAGIADPAAAAGTIAQSISTFKDVLVVTPPTFNAAGDTAILNVIPKSGPSSPDTVQLVADIRAAAAGIHTQTGATISVTGQTAIVIDISRKLGDALLPYLLVVVGLAFLLLTLVFRSLLIPLTATLGFLLSVVATFGAVVAVFQWGWFAWLFGVAQPSAIISLLPVFMIGVVFGLAMDYQVFLVTRMREEHVHGLTAQEAVVVGFGHGARVVAAAAVIMMGVFGGFILGADALIKSIGFAFAIAVFFDAFVVRMTIVPAVLTLLGERAWWLPRWLDRLLPNVDIEGAKLAHRIEAASAATATDVAPEAG